MSESFLNGKITLHCGDSLAVLPTLPETSAHRALAIGTAAEHLVCADLILAGYRAFMVGAGLPYDVAIEYQGRLFRVQVKSTAFAKPTPGRPKSTLSYMFHVRRAGKGAKRIIADSEFDLLALVALDIRVVAYVPFGTKVRQTIHLRERGSFSQHANKRHDNIDGYPIGRALHGIRQ